MNSSVTERPLDAQQLTRFAVRIEQQRRFRHEQVQHQRAETGRPDTMAQREVNEILLRAAQTALGEIDAARRRLKTGNYGRCVDCRAQLPLDRLEVVPWVARCAQCHRAHQAAAP